MGAAFGPAGARGSVDRALAMAVRAADDGAASTGGNVSLVGTVQPSGAGARMKRTVALLIPSSVSLVWTTSRTLPVSRREKSSLWKGSKPRTNDPLLNETGWVFSKVVLASNGVRFVASITSRQSWGKSIVSETVVGERAMGRS